MVILTLPLVYIWGFPSGSSPFPATSLGVSSQSSPSEASQCPYVKFFPRYRVDLISRKKPKRKESSPSSWFSALVPLKGLSESLSKRQIQHQIRPGERWIHVVQKDGIPAFARLWTEADHLLQESAESSVVISLPDATPPLVQNWVNILSWLGSNYPRGSESIQLNATILDGTQEGTATSVRLEKHGAQTAPVARSMVDPIIINQRTQSWVKRILVEQGICPFTKSVKMSGQGLADVGVPVASIAYHASHAVHPVTLLAHTFQAIEEMLQAGPIGKNGVSSILLAAPGFDEDFDLWSGPIFAILEASVVAAMAESQIGVVCFHPKYACPDGSSWPGFGHMHSVTRLEKWYQEARSSNEASECPILTTEDVAAGGEKEQD
jgi:hypothetical protein